MFSFTRTVSRLLMLLLMLTFGQIISSCEDDRTDPSAFGTIEGTVSDANGPLAGVSVTSNPGTSASTTDAQGKYTLPNVQAGKYALTFRKEGFNNETANVTVTEGATTVANYILSRSTGGTTNQPPNLPFSPKPADQDPNQPVINLRLSWRVSDPNGKSDSLKSSVTLREGISGVAISLLRDSRDTSVVVPQLQYNTTYFWQVTVQDKAGLKTNGPIWSFTTVEVPNNAYVFVRNQDIYSSDVNGGNLVRLTNTPLVFDTSPRLRPNTLDKVAYISNAALGQYQLYVMNRDGSGKKPVSFYSVDPSQSKSPFCWSPDGSQLLFASGNRLYKVNADGANLQQVLGVQAEAGYTYGDLDWTDQNGGKIVVQLVGSNFYDTKLQLMNADFSSAQTFATGTGGVPNLSRVEYPSFSFDGRRILYNRTKGSRADVTGTQTDVDIIERTISPVSETNLSTAQGTSGKPVGSNDLYPRYVLNDSKIVFVRNDAVSSLPKIWQMDVDGKSRVQVLNNDTGAFPEGKRTL